MHHFLHYVHDLDCQEAEGGYFHCSPHLLLVTAAVTLLSVVAAVAVAVAAVSRAAFGRWRCFSLLRGGIGQVFLLVFALPALVLLLHRLPEHAAVGVAVGVAADVAVVVVVAAVVAVRIEPTMEQMDTHAY